MGKPTPKTVAEVKAEIKRLQEMKPFVRKTTHFGDDNHERIDAQIRVLEEAMDEDDIWNEWPEEEEHQDIRSQAEYALRWSEGEEKDSPSKDWSWLDSRNKKAKA